MWTYKFKWEEDSVTPVYVLENVRERSHSVPSVSLSRKLHDQPKTCIEHKVRASFVSTDFVLGVLAPISNQRLTVEICTETHVLLLLKCPLFLTDFKRNFNMSTYFIKSPQY